MTDSRAIHGYRRSPSGLTSTLIQLLISAFIVGFPQVGRAQLRFLSTPVPVTTPAGDADSPESLDRRLQELKDEVSRLQAALTLHSTESDSTTRELIERRTSTLLLTSFYLTQYRAALKDAEELRTLTEKPAETPLPADKDKEGAFIRREALLDLVDSLKDSTRRAQAAGRSLDREREDAEATLKKKEQILRLAREGAGSGSDVVNGHLSALEEEIRAQQALITLKKQESQNLKQQLEITQKRIDSARDQINLLGSTVLFDASLLEKLLTDLESEEKSLLLQLGNAQNQLGTAEKRLSDFVTRHAEPSTSETPAAFEIQESLRFGVALAQRETSILGEQIRLVTDLREAWRRRHALWNGMTPFEQQLEWKEQAKATQSTVDQDILAQSSALADLTKRLGEIERQSKLSETPPGLIPYLDQNRKELQRILKQAVSYSADLENAQRIIRRLSSELTERSASSPLKIRLISFWTTLVGFWNYELTAVDDHPITVGKVLGALLLMIAGVLLSNILSRQIGERLLRHFGVASGAVEAIQSLIFYVLVIVFSLFALHLVHVPLTVFTLLGGALAIGIGFGSQNLMSNFISGLILLIERPIRVGDLVQVDSHTGRVKHIGPRSTRILMGNNIDVMVPNAAILEKTVINWTLLDQRIRGSLTLGVAYGSDADLVRKTLLELAMEHALVLKDPAPHVLLTELAESAITFQLFFWFRVTELIGQAGIESDLRFAILKRFAILGISIPFAQRDVHLVQNAPIELTVSRAQPKQTE